MIGNGSKKICQLTDFAYLSAKYVYNKAMHIYAIRNKRTGKKYIGSTKNVARRWSNHKSLLNSQTHHNAPLQKDWIKYGKDNFSFMVLEVIEDENLLVETEQKWMNATKYKYNVFKNAASPLGFKQSEKTITKRLDTIKQNGSRTGLPKGTLRHTSETKAKISAAGKGRVCSKETIMKRIAATIQNRKLRALNVEL